MFVEIFLNLQRFFKSNRCTTSFCWLLIWLLITFKADVLFLAVMNVNNATTTQFNIVMNWKWFQLRLLSEKSVHHRNLCQDAHNRLCLARAINWDQVPCDYLQNSTTCGTAERSCCHVDIRYTFGSAFEAISITARCDDFS